MTRKLVYLSPPVFLPVVKKWLIKWKRKGGKEQRKLIDDEGDANEYAVDIQEGKIK